MDGLLTPGEVMKRLNLKPGTFYAYQRRGFFRFALAARPIGTRRYVASRIDAMAAGESAVQLRARRSA